jgi:hypothetical protein
MHSDTQLGYTFYTKNKDFHRLHGLYKMIFDVTYRETLAKDGAHEYLSKGRFVGPRNSLSNQVAEFKQSADALGISKISTVTLACYLPQPWYYVVPRSLFLDYPMVCIFSVYE